MKIKFKYWNFWKIIWKWKFFLKINKFEIWKIEKLNFDIKTWRIKKDEMWEWDCMPRWPYKVWAQVQNVCFDPWALSLPMQTYIWSYYDCPKDYFQWLAYFTSLMVFIMELGFPFHLAQKFLLANFCRSGGLGCNQATLTTDTCNHDT